MSGSLICTTALLFLGPWLGVGQAQLSAVSETMAPPNSKPCGSVWSFLRNLTLSPPTWPPLGTSVFMVGLFMSESQLWTQFSVFHQGLGLGFCFSIPEDSMMVKLSALSFSTKTRRTVS